ncbi:MAG: hypothetical protein ABIK09_14635 [Pseudomonadota bacterium]
MHRHLFICFLAFALFVTACDTGDGGGQTVPGEDTAGPGVDTLVPGDDTLVPGDDTVPTDPNPPEVSLVLTQYTAIAGEVTLDATWADDVAVTAVEVLVDDEVVGALDLGRGSFDSTVCPHGAHALSLRALDAAGNATTTEPIIVIFAGKGQFLPYLDGWSDGEIPGWGGLEISVPVGATSLYDQKAHVTMPEGIGVVKSYLQWRTNVSWSFGYDIGTGNCPDSGMKLAATEKQADQWLLEVVYEDAIGAPTGTWFAHIRFLDAGDHAGESAHLNSLFLVVPKH